MNLYPQLIIDALKQVKYPGTGKNIVEAEMVDDNLRIDGHKVSFSIIFPKNPDPFQKSVVKAAEAAIHTYAAKEAEVSVSIGYKPTNPQTANQKFRISDSCKVIAVSSGKGGVYIERQQRPVHHEADHQLHDRQPALFPVIGPPFPYGAALWPAMPSSS